MLLVILSVSALAYGIVGLREDRLAPAALVGGAVLLAVFVVRSLRAPAPMVDLRLFARRSVATANAITFVFCIAFSAIFFCHVFFLTGRWHLSIMTAGLYMSPAPLTVVPVAVVTGRFADRIGYGRIFVVGGLLFATAGLWLIRIADMPSAVAAVWFPAAILLGFSIGLVLPSLSGASVTGLPPQQYATGSGINQAVRQFGSVIGIALIVVLLGDLGATAHFEHGYLILVVGGLLTALGGATLPRAALAATPRG